MVGFNSHGGTVILVPFHIYLHFVDFQKIAALDCSS